MTTLLSFLFALALLVFIHELGHYSVARWCGVKVLRFSIGFGKPLLTWRVGPDRTEWSLSPIPLGGYVKMLDEREDGGVDPKEAHRAFNRQSLAKRSAIVIAGPAANFVLAIILYGLLAMSGLQEPAPVLGAPPAGSAASAAGLRYVGTMMETNASAIGNQPQHSRAVTRPAEAIRQSHKVAIATGSDGRSAIILGKMT